MLISTEEEKEGKKDNWKNMVALHRSAVVVMLEMNVVRYYGLFINCRLPALPLSLACWASTKPSGILEVITPRGLRAPSGLFVLQVGKSRAKVEAICPRGWCIPSASSALPPANPQSLLP